MKATTPKPRRRPAAKPASKPPLQAEPSNVIYIAGSGNVIAGRDVHIHNSPPQAPQRLKVTPGVGHLSVEQRRVITKMVMDVADTEARLKQRPKGPAAVYLALFSKFTNVKKLEQIPLDGFDVARGYLHQWLGRLNNMASAPVKNADAWRRKRYQYIKVNSKEPEAAAAMAAYILRNFKAESLTELSNDELDRTYRYVAGRKIPRN